MTTEAKKVTRAAVQAAARKRWPKATVIESRGYITAAQRATNIQLRGEITSRIVGIDARLKELHGCDRALRDAARFLVDVEGDPTVLPQLRAALEPVEERDRLREEREEIRKERDSIDEFGYRWRVVVDGEMFRHVKCQADTLEGLLAIATRVDHIRPVAEGGAA